MLISLQLMKEKQNSATLEEYIKKNSNVCSNSVKELEELLEQKEQDINRLYNELHEVTKKFSNCSQRARTLETELERCSIELQQKTSEIDQRDAEVEEMSKNMEILRGSLVDTQEMYKKEAAKAEKFKTAVMLCNNKMVELEKTTESQKSKIRSLEQKLESIQTEVKSKTEELEAIKSPMRRKKTTKNTDVDSFSVSDASSISKKGTENTAKLATSSSPLRNKPKLEAGEHFSSTDHNSVMQELKKCKEELSVQQEKNHKLKSDQFKACEIIKRMISTREEEEKKNKALKQRIETLESELKALKGEGADLHKTKSLHAKINEMKFTASGSTSPSHDNEVLLSPKSAKTARALKKK